MKSLHSKWASMVIKGNKR